MLVGFLNPLTTLWWPLVRLVDVFVDSVTATLVWRVGAHLYGRRPALAAGLVYAVNPLVLVSAVRVDQEVPITALSMAGLTLLLTNRSTLARGYPAAAAAGACLGQHVGSSIPRSPFCRSMCLRRHGGLLRVRKPLWLVLGFATGCVFILTRSAYSPYFVPIAPFAARLGAPLAVRLIRIPRSVTVLGGLAIAIAWAAGIRLLGSERGYVIASRFSDIRPVIQLIERSTSPGTPILANRLEYAYLAGRPWVAHYFWDDHDMLSAQYLQRRLTGRSMVVLYPYSDRRSYPKGFVTCTHRPCPH